MSKLYLFLLGPPRVQVDQRYLEITRRKTLALLAYLAGSGERQQHETLAALLWPDLDQRQARAALRRSLSELNKSLGKGWLAADRESVGLDQEADIWLDVAQFQQRLADCQTHGHAPAEVCPACLDPLTEAADLYRADFLTGFTLPDCPGFDEWQFLPGRGAASEFGFCPRAVDPPAQRRE
jgi:DNA-binding SARP family transcriptional activator